MGPCTWPGLDMVAAGRAATVGRHASAEQQRERGAGLRGVSSPSGLVSVAGATKAGGDTAPEPFWSRRTARRSPRAGAARLAQALNAQLGCHLDQAVYAYEGTRAPGPDLRLHAVVQAGVLGAKPMFHHLEPLAFVLGEQLPGTRPGSGRACATLRPPRTPRTSTTKSAPSRAAGRAPAPLPEGTTAMVTAPHLSSPSAAVRGRG
jgi:hypothetical protein